MPVRQLTLRLLSVLFACDSPFLAGGFVGPEHVAQFIWIVSPRFSPDAEVRKAFMHEIAMTVPYDRGIVEIDRYVEEATFDRPPSQKAGADREAFTSFLAGWVDILAFAYGWDDEAILDKPLARLYQYHARIAARNNPKAPRFNPLSSRVIGQWLRDKEKKKAQADSDHPPATKAQKKKPTAAPRSKKKGKAR